MTSAFDPSAFTGQQFSDELDTRPAQVPSGEYVAICKQPEFRQSQGKKDPSKWYTWCDINMELQLPPDIAQQLGRTVSNVRYSFALDLNEQGHIDTRKGQNWRLGQILAACRISPPWGFDDIAGKMIKVKVKAPATDDGFSEIESIGQAS
jgi:hypothetical protein